MNTTESRQEQAIEIIRKDPEYYWLKCTEHFTLSAFFESRPYVFLSKKLIAQKELFLALSAGALYLISHFREKHITSFFGFQSYLPKFSVAFLSQSLIFIAIYFFAYIIIDLTIGFALAIESKLPSAFLLRIAGGYTFTLPNTAISVFSENSFGPLLYSPFVWALASAYLIEILPCQFQSLIKKRNLHSEIMIRAITKFPYLEHRLSGTEAGELLKKDSKKSATSTEIDRVTESFFDIMIFNGAPILICLFVVYNCLMNDNTYPETNVTTTMKTIDSDPYYVVRQYEDETLLVQLDPNQRPKSWKIISRSELKSLDLKPVTLNSPIKKYEPVSENTSLSQGIFSKMRDSFSQESKDPKE